MHFMVFTIFSYYVALDILNKYVSQARIGGILGKGYLRQGYVENKQWGLN